MTETTSSGPASMAEVARRAGVSTSTVSRALRGSSLVNAETTARVRQAALEVGFAVSRAASSLATGRLSRVAVMVSGSLSSWFNASLLDAAYGALSAADQELLIYRLLDLDQREHFFTTMPARRNADALIVASFALSAAERARLEAAQLPVVYVNQRVPGAAAVTIDDDAGARAGARHLLNLGHRDVAFVGLRTRFGFSYSATTRERSFAAEIAAGGGRTVSLTAGAPGQGRSVVAELLSGPLPTALMAESDELAVSVVLALREAGVRVPEDVSVIGFDDDASAELLGLSTVAQPVSEIGTTAAELALQLAAGAESARRTVTLTPRLVVRRTTHRPAQR